jgi:hypothetical protein
MVDLAKARMSAASDDDRDFLPLMQVAMQRP